MAAGSDAVCVNARFLSQRVTGVQRFAITLGMELKKRRPGLMFLAPPCGIDPFLMDALRPEIVGTHGGHYWEQVELPAYLRRIGRPLLVSFCGLTPVSYPRSVLTIHDLALYRHPEWFDWKYRWLYKTAYRLSVSRVRRILTGSGHAKGEIVELLGVRPDAVEVIFNSPAPAFLGGVPAKDAPGDHGRYVLSVASLEPRKNFSRLVEAFSLLDDPGCRLMIVGGKGRAFSSFSPEKLAGGRVVFTGYLEDGELAGLYRGASLFMYPSLYEGFGLPPLEAMACGCPVAVSNATSLPEVCGDAAFYFDPLNVRDMAETMAKALREPAAARTERIERGWARVRLFSTGREADKLLAILDGLEGSNYGTRPASA